MRNLRIKLQLSLAFALTLAVHAQAHAASPVTTAASKTVTEDTTLTVDLTAYASDADGDALTYYKSNAAYCTCSVTAAGQMTIRPNANYTGTGAFCRFYVKDAGGTSSNISRLSLTITAVNDAPRSSAQLTAVTEDMPQALTLVATDVDTAAASLTYSIVRMPTYGTLSAVSGSGVTYTPRLNSTATDSFTFKTYDGALYSNIATVTLTITAVNDAPSAGNGNLTTNEDESATLALAAMDPEGSALTYEIVGSPANGSVTVMGNVASYAPNPDSSGSDAFTFRVYETATPSSVSNTATVSVTVNAVNDAPLAIGGEATVDEDSSVGITLSALDAEGDALTYELVSLPAHGTASLVGTTVTYEPNENSTDADGFTFRAYETGAPSSVSNTAAISINVNAVNDAPTAEDLSVETTEGVSVTLNLATNDPDGDALEYSFGTPVGGTVSRVGDVTTYAPNPDYSGTDSFSYAVSDGKASGNANVTVTVVSANHAPVATPASHTLDEDEALTIALSGSDEDGDALTYQTATDPAHGTVTVVGNEATYVPAADYNGSDVFAFTVSDGEDVSSPAEISLTIDAVNDAPTADPVSISLNEDASATVTYSATDPDGESVTYSVATDPSHGTVTAPSGSASTYAPSSNYFGTDTFTYVATDASGNASDPATVTATVANVNDAPEARNVPGTTTTGTAVTVLLSATDADGDSLTYRTSIAPSSSKGTVQYSSDASGSSPASSCVSPTSGCYAVVTPAASYTGSILFYYSASDGVRSDSATVNVTVSAPNSAPVATDVSATTDEDTTASITLSATDAEGSSLTYRIVDAPTHGSATLATRTVTYTPASDYSGTDSFTYEAYETSSATSVSNTATVSVTVNSRNDAPTASDVSASTDQGVAVTFSLAASDVENDALTYVFGTPAGGTVSETGGVATYVPNPTYFGADTFAYGVNDGTDLATANVTVTVASDDETPVASDASAELNEDETAVITLAATDSDSTSLTYAVATSPVHGSVSLVGNQATYVPEEDYNGTDSFTFTATDSVTTSPAATVSLTINAIDDPVGGDFTVSMTEGDEYELVDVGLPESDGGDRYATCTATPAHGYLSTYYNSCFYVPDADYSGTDEFSYTASIGGITATGTIRVEIAPVNDAPVANGDYASTDQDTPVTVTLSSADVDEGDTTTYAIASAPGFGTVSLAGDQATYTPNAGASGRDSFTFSVTDAAGLSDTASYFVTVGNNNDAPTVQDVTAETPENAPVDITLLGSDPDGDELTYFVTASESGTTEVSGSTLSFTPDRGFDGTATVSYQATDGGLSVSNTGTVTVSVTGGTNDAPTAEDTEATLNEDRSTVIVLTASDPENAALTYSVETSPAHGSVTLDGNEATYAPEADYYGSDSFTFTASDGVNASEAATVAVTINAIADPVIRCDTEIDDIHIVSETTASGTTVEYFDNLITVGMERVATAAELTEIVATAGATATVCSAEQPPLSSDEAAGLIDTADTGYAIYTIEVPTQSDLASLDAIAANVQALSYVASATPVEWGASKVGAAESDAEAWGYTWQAAIEPTYFKWIQLKGGLDYLRAFQAQGNSLASVSASVSDTGTCATGGWECASDMGGVPEKFTGIRAGTNFIGTLKAGEPAYPIGIIDRFAYDDDPGTAGDESADSRYHGTAVALLMAGASNGDEVPGTTMTALESPLGSGVLGSAWRLNYSLTSYLNLAGAGNYDWDSVRADANYRILLDMCGDDVTNHSYNYYLKNMDPTTQWPNARAQNAYMKRAAEACPQTFYVYASGNETTDFSSDTSFAGTSLARASSAGNTVEVQATGLNSYEVSAYSNYGSGITVASPGDYTSYAAPIVAGTAGLLKAIDKSLSPSDIKSLLESSGKANSTNTPVLDVAAATLLAIKGKNADYAPMSLKLLSTSLDKSLSVLRSSDVYSGGTHKETGNWKFENNTLTIERTATESASSGVPGPNAGESDAYYEWQMESKLESREKFEVGLSQIADGSRQIPVGVFLPKGAQSHKLSGKFHAYHFGEDAVGDLMVEDHAQAYCFQLDYGMNSTEAAKDGNGFHVPLARDSSSPSHTVSQKISGATLTGNLTKKVYNYWNPETTYDEEIPNEAGNSGDETDYASLTSPSCSGDVTVDENSATFDAWVNRLENIETGESGEWQCTESWDAVTVPDTDTHCECPSGTECYVGSCLLFGVCYQVTWTEDQYGIMWPDVGDSAPMECETTTTSREITAAGSASRMTGMACSPDDPVPDSLSTSGTCTCVNVEPTYGCSVNALEESSPWAPEEVEIGMNVAATFGDVNCSLTMTSTNGDLNSASNADTVDIDVTSDYLQTFRYVADDAGSAQCTVTATVNVTTSFLREYESADSSPCDIGPMTRVLKSEDAFTVDVTWDFGHGEFPAKDFFTKFEEQLGTVVDEYQTMLEEDSEIGTPDSYFMQSPFEYLGTGETHFLPETLLFGGFYTPGFGIDMEDMNWAHGIGPVKNDSDDENHGFEITSFQKLDRNWR